MKFSNNESSSCCCCCCYCLLLKMNAAAVCQQKIPYLGLVVACKNDLQRQLSGTQGRIIVD